MSLLSMYGKQEHSPEPPRSPGVDRYRITKALADIRDADKKVTQAEAQRDLLLSQKRDAEARKAAAEKELGMYDLVQILLQDTSDYARQQAKTRMEDIVSEALNVVFGGDHKFEIRLEVRSNRPEADYYLDDGVTVTQLQKPDFDRGGGKVDVIALALRLAVAELEGVPGPIFMDEVGKHVSAEYAPHVGYFLREYCTNFDRQIILITHNTALAEVGDTSIQVTNKDGVSIVKHVGGAS